MNRKTHQNITTVSLGDTWEIKQNLMREGGNFSRFVRNCLREWARYEQEIPCHFELHEDRLLKCFPRESRLCLKCWPDGPPVKHDWTEYAGTHLGRPGEAYDDEKKRRLSREFQNHEWIAARAAEYNAKLGGDNWTVKDLAWRGRPPKAKPEKVKRGFWARMKVLLR